MTASAAVRHRATQLGGLAAVGALILFVVVMVIAVTTLRTSKEGRAPEADNRVVVAFPQTPNAVVGIVDDLDRLASLAVLTLDPGGVGGSVVVVPVNVDTTNGFGPTRRPLSREPYPPGDESQTARLATGLEPLLTLTIERSVVLGPDELAALLEPLAPFEVDLPEPVVDSDTTGSGIVVEDGEQTLDVEEMVEAFTAISVEGVAYDHHDIDLALWSAFVDAADRAPAAEVPLDADGLPVAPETGTELVERLFAGGVGVRDLRINASGTKSAENEDGSDFVVADRRDPLLVFGAISPGLVLKPNESLSFKLVVAFDDAQIATLGEDADGTPVTKESMTLRFIGELLFEQANVVAVDLADAPATLPQRTQLYVADETFVEAVRNASPRFFTNADVVVADEVTDGVDVVVVLGTDFLGERADLIAAERADALAAEQEDDGTGDFEVTSDFEVTPDPATTADTVDADG
jgi:hypothetical protein